MLFTNTEDDDGSNDREKGRQFVCDKINAGLSLQKHLLENLLWIVFLRTNQQKSVKILRLWNLATLTIVIMIVMLATMEKVKVLVNVMALLISILILISFQEATLASGGKNKAVRDLYFLLAEDLVLVTILTILMHTETNIN